MSFSNWNIGKPYNYSGEEDCVRLVEYTHKWNDSSCALNNSYICQKPQGKSIDIQNEHVILLVSSMEVRANVATKHHR